MHGCLRLIVGLLAVWLLGALTTLVLPLGERPRNEAERRYHQNAREMRDYINNNPIAVLLTHLLVIRTEVADLRRIPGSCGDVSDESLPDHRDIAGTVTDYGIWGIPLQRYGTSCGGLMITRGRTNSRPQAPQPSGSRGSSSISQPPPPPLPPPRV